MAVLEVLHFSATSFLVSYKLISYKKEFHSITSVVVSRRGLSEFDLSNFG